MIDLTLLREHPALVAKEISKKDPTFDTNALITLYIKLYNVRREVETLRAKKNELTALAKGGITEEIREQSKEVGAELKKKETDLKTCESTFNDLYLRVPNIPLSDVPVGGEEQNKVVRVCGEKPVFAFAPKNHLDLAVANGWVDFEAAATMTGANFALYKSTGVDVVYALALMMFTHNRSHKYEPILPPYLVNERSLYGAGNFPRFKEDVYAITDEDLYLTPTAEVNLTNLYRDAIIPEKDLPIRLTSWTSCFRREAGGYGASDRGLIRLHQFEKVELYTLCTPDKSNAEQERMLAVAEELLEKLGFHYRVVLLATQESSFPSARTYDIEVWMPGQQGYREVASISNCTDFQARRSGIRYRSETDHKIHLVNTLNGSSLAISRIMAALIEYYQQEDGTIDIPSALRNVTFSF